MPIYEYDCQSCGQRTEVIQRVGERPVKICPRCGGKLKKAFSAPAIRFKGSGWYINDYSRAKKEEGKGEKSSSSDKAESGDKAEKGEKTEKGEKGETGEKGEKGEKAEKKAEPKKETKGKKGSEKD